MSLPADLVLTNATVHTLEDPDRTHGALAVRDGRVVRLGDPYDVQFLAGASTRVVDCDGGVVLPGFVDAHTHLDTLGAHLVHADLSTATTRDEALAALAARADDVAPGEWVLGYGYDESAWSDRRHLTRAELDEIAHDGPVAAIREDMHLVSVNGAALEALPSLPEDDVRREGGEPTGVLVEEAAEVVHETVAPDRAEARDLVAAAAEHAVARGVTTVHDMVRRSAVARAHRDLAQAGDLPLRVRINYWADFLEHVERTGLATNAGGRVQTGAMKTYTDGSLGGYTARLSAPYEDALDERGTWVVDPDELAAFVERVEAADLQAAAHAIGDEAVDAVVDAYAACDAPGEARHRVEHAELASDETIERMADLGVVASVQPNFLKWADEGGLYDDRIGERRTQATRLGALVDAGVPVAFGSDCMPLDPLFGVHQAVTAPTEGQRLGVTEALRAYTRGGAYAGFDEDRLGRLAEGARADLVVLEDSPWDRPDDIADLTVEMTVVDGDVVHETEG